MPVLIFCYIILVHCLPVQHGWIPGVNTIFLQINAIGVLQFTSPMNGIFKIQSNFNGSNTLGTIKISSRQG